MDFIPQDLVPEEMTEFIHYTAGFIEGFTGGNHLEELDTCFTGGQGFIEEIRTALLDIEAGDYIKGVGDFGVLVNDFPEALSNCKNMSQDIAAIEDWAAVFTEPQALMQQIFNNYMSHSGDIMASISKEKADWAAGEYYKAG